MKDDLKLVNKEDGLYLEGDGLSIHGDYSQLAKRIKPSRLFDELLVKAVKIKDFKGAMRIVDATAGLGEDSFILAASGAKVTLIERDEMIAELLKDTLSRAALDPSIEEIARRMSIAIGDSKDYLENIGEAPDVVFLDPMFPERAKSGLIKKKFQLLQELETPCEEEEELLSAAMHARPQKIVVKRPLKGPYLANKKPSYQLLGKAIRYDIYVL